FQNVNGHSVHLKGETDADFNYIFIIQRENNVKIQRLVRFIGERKKKKYKNYSQLGIHTPLPVPNPILPVVQMFSKTHIIAKLKIRDQSMNLYMKRLAKMFEIEGVEELEVGTYSVSRITELMEILRPLSLTLPLMHFLNEEFIEKLI
ncbi:hypothetical protein PFISCL1PPCAC_2666, partial [Pristionchus fissidentatus]